MKLNENDDCISCLLAHNFVEQFKADGSLLSRSFCEEECILYAGDLRDKSVVSGTVFRSILIWELSGQTS